MILDSKSPSTAPYPVWSLLRHLEVEQIQRLSLCPVRFEAGQRIGSRGQEVRHIVFLETGAASLMVPFRDGSQTEAGFLDSESIVGLAALLGQTTWLHDAVMQVAGSGYLCRRETALQEFARSQTFHQLVLNSACAQLAETAQLAGCYAMHGVSQPLSRWLLTYQDRTGCEVIEVTQEVLSQILGATRPTISKVSESLERRGIIQVRRGKITVLNKHWLEAEACECYFDLRRLRAQPQAAVSRKIYGYPTAMGRSSLDESLPITHETVGRDGARRTDRYLQ